MSYQASDYSNAIPSKSTYSPSDHQKSYKDGQTIRFHIQPFNAFLDPRQSSLNFKVLIKNAPTIVTFSKRCGIHSLIDAIRIYDMEGTQLENIQNYAELTEKLHFYSENTSIRNKRGLTELLEYTSRDFDGVEYDDKPARNFDQSQLFNHEYLTGTEATYGANVDYSQDPNTCEVAFRLYSGILGAPSEKMFPIMLTSGLRVEIDLNRADKALQVWSLEGICNDDGTLIESAGKAVIDSCRFGVATALPITAAPLTSVNLYTELNPGFNQVIAGVVTQPAIDAGVSLVKNQLVGAANLRVGATLYGIPAAGGAPVSMGVIEYVSCNSGENAGGAIAVQVGLDGSGANGSLFQGGSGVGGVAVANTCFIRKSDIEASLPTIEVSDVRLILKTAAPPQSYIDKLVKQTQTEEGASIEYLTWDIYRNNVTASEQQIQINMPTINSKALSVLTLPVQNSSASSLINDNNNTIVDDADNYQYVVANKLQPTRKVDLTPISQTISKIAQVASYEFEKALASSKIHVKNLDFQESSFAIGRPLARFGGVYNLADDGNLSLRIEYGSPQQNKLFINYIAGYRRLVVSKAGKFVEV